MRQSISSVARLLLFAAAAMIVLSVGRQSTGGQQDEEGRRYQRRVQEDIDELRAEVAKFQGAKNSREAGKLCLSLFPTPFDDSLELLLRHDDPHVAIQAAWRRYSRMVRNREVRFGSQNAALDPRDVQRFLGFLEGRSRVLVPKWWEKALADPEENVSREEERLRLYWLNLEEVVKRVDNSHATMEIYSERIKIPAKTFKFLSLGSEERMGVAMDEEYLVMMPYRSDGGGVRLACVDLSQSKELWQADIWGLGEVGPRSGPPLQHYMTMKIVGDWVFIFGATRQGVYVEAFALKDGTPLIRFATTNWFVDRPEK